MNISRIPGRIVSYVVSKAPQMTISGERANKAVAWVGKHISSPENRFILGATVLMSQPLLICIIEKLMKIQEKFLLLELLQKLLLEL